MENEEIVYHITEHQLDSIIKKACAAFAETHACTNILEEN